MMVLRLIHIEHFKKVLWVGFHFGTTKICAKYCKKTKEIEIYPRYHWYDKNIECVGKYRLNGFMYTISDLVPDIHRICGKITRREEKRLARIKLLNNEMLNKRAERYASIEAEKDFLKLYE